MTDGEEDMKKRFVMKLSAYTSFGISVILAFSNAIGMCEENGAAVVLTLFFEALGLFCLWQAGGQDGKKN